MFRRLQGLGRAGAIVSRFHNHVVGKTDKYVGYVMALDDHGGKVSFKRHVTVSLAEPTCL